MNIQTREKLMALSKKTFGAKKLEDFLRKDLISISHMGE